MEYISGELFLPDGVKEGYITFEKNKCIETRFGTPPKKPLFEGLITPLFVNAHTHIGDSFIAKKGIKLPRDIVELVAPPNGLKHKLLQNTSVDEIIGGMKESIDAMINGGTFCFCDFREGGLSGVKILKNTLDRTKINGFILSRPLKLKYDKNEIKQLLESSDGIGLSSITDWDYSEIEKIAGDTKSKGKIFSLHASERCREDIDRILDLKPDFLVHMIYASESDLMRVKENDIPIIICPRSNFFFGLKTNYSLMKKVGIDLVLGTDNAMINKPEVLEELKFIRNNTDIFSIYELFNMITYIPRKALNLDYSILGLNFTAGFIVIDKKNLRVLYCSTHKY